MSTLVAFVLVFGTIVFFHEMGHFLVAKLVGIRVYEFSLGFGPGLITKRLGETLYSIRSMPLGGFVKLAGMDDPVDEDAEVIKDTDSRSFASKPIPLRMATIAAGPLMNFVLAIVLFGLYFMLIVVPPTITMVEPGSPAESVGLRPGDSFVSVNEEPVSSTDDVVSAIQGAGSEQIVVTVQRAGEQVELRVVPDGAPGEGRIGVYIDEKPQLPLGQSIVAGFMQTIRMTQELVTVLGRMVTGQMEPEIAGPIGIYQVVGETARQGAANLLLLAAVLNINLGLLNLLPVPILDGGWLVLLGIEGVRGKPVNPEYRGIAQFIGLALLILLMVFATFKDITRLDFFS